MRRMSSNPLVATVPDGERFLGLTSPEPPGPRREIVVITNFFDELRRRVPVD